MRWAVLPMLLFFGFLALAQDCTQAIPINVLDKKTGMAVMPLQPGTFQARMGEVAIPISGVQKVEHRRVLVLVDQSGSMAPKNSVGIFQKEALEAVDETMGKLLEELPAGTSVAYGFFNDAWVFTPGFLSDPAQLRAAIVETRKQLPRPGKGETPLFDALHQAMLRFGEPQPGDTIMVLPDTGENRSKIHPGAVEEELRRSGLRLALLLVQQHAPVEVTPYWDTLISLAEDTGGAVGTIETADRSWLSRKDSEPNREALRRFWTQEVLGGYVMRVQTPTTLAKARKWSVRIDARTSPELKGAIIQYPPKLTPCTVSTAAAH